MPRPVGEQVVVVTGAPRAPYVTSKFAPRGCYDTPRMKQAGRHPAVKTITILPASIDTPIVEHARTKLGRMPMAPNPLYAPGVVARAIVRAAEHPRREVPVGGRGQRFAPAMMDFLLSRDFMMSGQRGTELANQGAHNRGDAAADTADHPGHTASQRLESSQKLRNVKQRSYFTELAWQQPLVKRALTAGIAAALAPRVLR